MSPTLDRAEPSPSAVPVKPASLEERLHALLPQTQCTKCGFAGCRPYAHAMATGLAAPNQCPPGGQEGVARLSNLLQVPIQALNPHNGVERPRAIAVIDPELCIGCTLCIQACPTDAIVGAAKQLHAVLPEHCTGCDLCLAPCPVDCITMIPVSGSLTGWAAWSSEQADTARQRYEQRQARLAREAEQEAQALEQKTLARKTGAQNHLAPENSAPLTASSDAEEAAQARKKALIAAALARVQKPANDKNS